MQSPVPFGLHAHIALGQPALYTTPPPHTQTHSTWPLGHWATGPLHTHSGLPVSLASPHSDNYLEPPSNHLTHSAYPLASTNKKLHTQPTHSPPPPSYAFPSPSSSPRSYIFVFWRYTLPLFRYTRRPCSMDGCVPPCGAWALNSGPCEDQSVLLTSEPSLQPRL